MAAVGGLFHNLGPFAAIGSSMHASQMGSNEFLFISKIRHFGPSGGRILADQRGIATNSIKQCYGARGWSGKLGYLLHMGEMHKPHSCCAKARTRIQNSFAEPVAAGKQNGKTRVDWRKR
jgi:hypothetical protein